MPRKIQDFAQQSLIKPVLVNVGRAGATNLDIIQEVEYVKQEAKMVYLLECLQKTPPPVIVFSDNKNEVDGKLGSHKILHLCLDSNRNNFFIHVADIQEYLLLKGVEAVAIHGSKSEASLHLKFVIKCPSLLKKSALARYPTISSGRARLRHSIF